MNVFLTGGTGFVGGAVLRALLSHGHQVTALARSEGSAAALSAAGATALIGDITDVRWLSEQLVPVDAAIHTASPGGPDSAAVDTAIATAVARAFAGSGKVYLHTGGIWVYGNNLDISEESPLDPPELTAWRADVEKIALETDGARVVVIVPGIVYGEGKGIPTMIAGAPRDESGALHLIGDGAQHWTTVHTDDLADLYLLALEDPAADGYLVAANDDRPTVRELTLAAADAAGHVAIVAESNDESRARFGALFADALLLDQHSSARKARSLGWEPKSISLAEDLRAGSYTA
ncbi:MAG: NAD-dependent epimerase/dehydratase [Pseudonocardiales bacterium]|nr:NAD-dependent epimerase/dehydratase [Pseudonocardiales bacterium]